MLYPFLSGHHYIAELLTTMPNVGTVFTIGSVGREITRLSGMVDRCVVASGLDWMRTAMMIMLSKRRTYAASDIKRPPRPSM